MVSAHYATACALRLPVVTLAPPSGRTQHRKTTGLRLAGIYFDETGDSPSVKRLYAAVTTLRGPTTKEQLFEDLLIHPEPIKEAGNWTHFLFLHNL